MAIARNPDANPRLVSNGYALEISGHRYAVESTRQPKEFKDDFLTHAKRLAKLGIGLPARRVAMWQRQDHELRVHEVQQDDFLEEFTGENDIWTPFFWVGCGKDGPGPIATRDIRINSAQSGENQLIEQGHRLASLYHNGLSSYCSLTPDRQQWFLFFREEIDGLWQEFDSPRLCLAEVFRFVVVHRYSPKRVASVFGLSEESAQERLDQMFELLAFLTVAVPKYRPLIETSFELFYARSMSRDQWDGEEWW
ncbi:MAG: hypothetical protein ACYCYO_03785 [Bacilli bacterium]